MTLYLQCRLDNPHTFNNIHFITIVSGWDSHTAAHYTRGRPDTRSGTQRQRYTRPTKDMLGVLMLYNLLFRTLWVKGLSQHEFIDCYLSTTSLCPPTIAHQGSPTVPYQQSFSANPMWALPVQALIGNAPSSFLGSGQQPVLLNHAPVSFALPTVPNVNTGDADVAQTSCNPLGDKCSLLSLHPFLWCPILMDVDSVNALVILILQPTETTKSGSVGSVVDLCGWPKKLNF